MNVLETLQRIILLFLLGFPLIMICLIGFLSISILNVGTIFLFIGQVLIVPVLVMAIHLVSWILPGTSVPPSDVGLLVPSIQEAMSTSKFNVAPSYWVAHVVFLCSYIATNAYMVYTMDAPVQGAAWKTENRKARSLMILIVSILSAIALIVSRYYMTGSETPFGILIGLAAFVPAGYYWYQFATRNGLQNGDIFGIMQQVLPSMQDDTQATLCMKPT